MRELEATKEKLHDCQKHLDFVTHDYDCQIKDLTADLDRVNEDLDACVMEKLKPLIAELAVREKIQQKMSARVQDQETVNDAMKAVLKTPYLFQKFKSAVKRREKESTGRTPKNLNLKSETVIPPQKPTNRLLSARVGPQKNTVVLTSKVSKKDTNLTAALTPRDLVSQPGLSAREHRQTLDFMADKKSSINCLSEDNTTAAALDQ